MLEVKWWVSVGVQLVLGLDPGKGRQECGEVAASHSNRNIGRPYD